MVPSFILKWVANYGLKKLRMEIPIGPKCAHQKSVRRPPAARHCSVLPSVQADVSGALAAAPLPRPACPRPVLVCTRLLLSLLNTPPVGGCWGWGAELQNLAGRMGPPHSVWDALWGSRGGRSGREHGSGTRDPGAGGSSVRTAGHRRWRGCLLPTGGPPALLALTSPPCFLSLPFYTTSSP